MGVVEMIAKFKEEFHEDSKLTAESYMRRVVTSPVFANLSEQQKRSIGLLLALVYEEGCSHALTSITIEAEFLEECAKAIEDPSRLMTQIDGSAA